MIISTFNEMSKDGKIQGIVEKKVEELVKDVVGNSLRSYSDFSKELQKKLEASLVLKLDEIGILQYSEIITKAVVKRLNSGMIELADISAEKNIGKFVDDMFDMPANKIKLSELCEKLIEEYKEDNEDESSGEIGFKLVQDSEDRSYTSSYNWFTAYFKEDGAVEKESYSSNSYTYDYKIRILQDKKTEVCTISGIDMGFKGSIEQNLFTKKKYGFEKLLMDLYCRKSEIELDEDDCSTEWDRY